MLQLHQGKPSAQWVLADPFSHRVQGNHALAFPLLSTILQTSVYFPTAYSELEEHRNRGGTTATPSAMAPSPSSFSPFICTYCSQSQAPLPPPQTQCLLSAVTLPGLSAFSPRPTQVWYLQRTQGHFSVTIHPQYFNDHLYADGSRIFAAKALVPCFELFVLNVYIWNGF